MSTAYSYVNSPQLHAYSYETIKDQLSKLGDQFPNKDAFVCYDKRGKRTSITCHDVYVKSLAIGRFLVKMGIQKGDRVVLCTQNSIEMILLVFGSQLVGAITAFSTWDLADGSDVMELVENTGAVLLVVDNYHEIGVGKTADKLKVHALKHVLSIENCQIKYTSIENGPLKIVDLKQEISCDLPEVYPEDVATYFKTSGSSGKSKLAVHTHTSYTSNTYAVNECMAIDSSTSFFCDRPLGWGVGSARTYLTSGATRVLADTRSSLAGHIESMCDIIAREQCSHVYLPGYIVSDLLGRHELANKFSSVTSIMIAGERISKTYANLLGIFCRKLYVWYGSSESAFASFFSADDKSSYEAGIIGKPQQGVEMKITDTKGQIVPMGQSGEICVRSVFRLLGYRGMPEKFAQTVDAGNWVHSGDIGHIRADGNFVMEGRISESISVGTVKIMPDDVEKVLITCPDVLECVAVPVPDTRLYQCVCACVIFKPESHGSVKDVHTFCDQAWKDGAITKPKYILVFDTFPRLTNGKTDKKQLTTIAESRIS